MGTTNEHNGGRVVTPRGVPAILPLGTVEPVEKYGVAFSFLSPQAAKQSWPEMPYANRLLLGGGLLLAGLGAFIGTASPIYSAGAQAIFPYTVAGKQETCLSNLKQLQLALGLYAEDNDSHVPFLDYTDATGKRVTWVTALQPSTKPDNFVCPAGPAIASAQVGALSSYAMNPVPAGLLTTALDDPTKTLILADAGTKHDVSLLPPFPSWPSVASRAGTSPFDPTETNVDFRHSGNAVVLYIDGHTDTVTPGDWLTNTDPWGGSAAIRAALDRLAATDPTSGAFIDDLKRTDLDAAAAALKASPGPLKPVTAELVQLWTYNAGDETSDSVDALGWNLARASEQAGDPSVRASLDAETTRRDGIELSQTNATNLVPYTDPGQFTVNVPAYWTKSPGSDGNRTTCDIHSGLPTVFAHFESWNTTSSVNNIPLDWTGRENEVKAKYGNAYQRVSMTPFLWNGHSAELWESEIEVPGGPRVHLLYLGYADGWRAHVLFFRAPAKDFDSWRPFIQGLESSYIPQ